MTLSDINELAGQPVIVQARSGPFGTVEAVPLLAGDRIQFSTRFVEARGTVLEIDHGATYPVKVEYHVPEGKRIANFAPAEFINLTKEYP